MWVTVGLISDAMCELLLCKLFLISEISVELPK